MSREHPWRYGMPVDPGYHRTHRFTELLKGLPPEEKHRILVAEREFVERASERTDRRSAAVRVYVECMIGEC